MTITKDLTSGHSDNIHPQPSFSKSNKNLCFQPFVFPSWLAWTVPENHFQKITNIHHAAPFASYRHLTQVKFLIAKSRQSVSTTLFLQWSDKLTLSLNKLPTDLGQTWFWWVNYLPVYLIHPEPALYPANLKFRYMLMSTSCLSNSNRYLKVFL
jgi:hypothetical protein